jgi:large subunit ribosomal protein L4
VSSVEVKTPAGKTDGSVDLPADVFDVQANIALMHQVVVAQQAAARQGTHSTKTRGDVRGGGKKPYRQKGTGRARQGSTRAPQFAGGGIVHGPQPRDYAQRTPKKMKAAALRGALSDRARAGQLHVVTALVDGDTPSTKEARKAIAAISGARSVLLVLTRDDQVSWLSVRNLPDLHVLVADQLNTYDVLVNDDIVFTKAALEAFLAGPSRAVKASARSSEVTGDVDAAPYGAGSHAALADGSEPEGYPVKGNESSKLYHLPGTSFYNRTEAEVWFASAEDAEKAGFQLPPSQRKEDDK